MGERIPPLLVGSQPVVGLADTAAHAVEQRVAEAGNLHHGFEFARPDDEDVEICRGRHGGGAGHGLDGGQLAEVVPGVEDVDHPVGTGDRGRAVEDDEELPAEAAFPQDHLAGVDAEAFGDAGHLEQLLFRARGKPVHALQMTGPGRPRRRAEGHTAGEPSAWCDPDSSGANVAARWASTVRSRTAMLRKSASRKPGISAMAENSRGPMMSTSRSDSAVTVALRGLGSMAASSPKKSPAPRVFTRRPCWVTATEPVRIKKSSRPIRPSRA